MKYIFLSLLLFTSGVASADFKSIVFPAPNLPKDPVTGKSPYVGLTQGPTFREDLATAVSTGRAIALTSDQHGCNWAIASQVYAFGEGAVYTEPGSTTYNIYPRSTVLKYGCWLPITANTREFIYPVAPGAQIQIETASPILVPNFSELGYLEVPQNDTLANIEIPIVDKVKFVENMKLGVQLSQRQHGCPDFAKKPYIYVFNDVVIYARLDNSTFSVFTKNLVESKQCTLPKVSYKAPQANLVPFNFQNVGLEQSPFFRSTNQSSAAFKYLDTDFNNQKCNASWSWQTKRPYAAYNATSTFAPNAKSIVSKTLKPNSPLISKPVKFTKFAEVVITKYSPKGEDRRYQSPDVVEAATNRCTNAAIDGLPRLYVFDSNRAVTLNDKTGPVIDLLIEDRNRIENKSISKDEMQREIDDTFISPSGYRFYPTFSQNVPGVKMMDATDATNSFRYYVLTQGNSSEYQRLRNENGNYFTNEVSVEAKFLDVVAHEESQGIRDRLPDWLKKDANITYQIRFACNAKVNPRELSLVFKEKSNPPSVVVQEAAKVSYVDTNDFLRQPEAPSKPLLGATKAAIETQTLYTYTPSENIQKLLKDQPERLFETRIPSTFVCSSGDHLPSLVLNSNGGEDPVATKIAVIKKFDFLYDAIKKYMLSTSLVDYVKLGYCQKLDETCTYDKSPELAAMLRNFQALQFEKFQYLNTHLDGLPMTIIADYYEMSAKVTYPEYVLPN